MSKSQSKNQHMKTSNPSDASTTMDTTRDNLDTNQSAQSMSSGDDDTTVNQGKAGDAVSALEDESSLESNSASDATTMTSSSEGTLLSRAASALDGQTVKKNLNLVKHKAQDMLSSGREQLSSKYSSLSDDVKIRGMMVDDKVKANPYAYALGAAGLGFILGRALSGKGKQDLDFLVSTVNKINFSTLAGYIGLKVEEKDSSTASEESSASRSKAGYNERQARKIG